jgi:hypothetical protein
MLWLPKPTNLYKNQATPQNKGVRINETAISTETATIPIRPSQQSKSILQSTTNSDHPACNTGEEINPSKNQPKEIHDCAQKLLHVYSNDGMKETSFHETDLAGLYPVWPIIEFSMVPTGTTKDERMSSFTKCVTALLGKMLYVDEKAMIAPISITNDDQASNISNKADLPTNFTKLGKHIVISGGSWVFNKKEKESNDVYTRFRLKLQIPTEDIINWVSFKFLCLGRKNLHKKQHQAMETKTPLILLFLCNGTDPGSILSDTKQMLDLAHEDIKENGMMPEEFEQKDIPHFTL